MDALTISAASGLRARMETLDMLANNLANASTGGFKLDREFYSLYVSPDAEVSPGAPTTVPLIEPVNGAPPSATGILVTQGSWFRSTYPKKTW